MEGKTKVKHKTHSNRCKECRIAHQCLPGMLTKEQLSQSEEFNFNSRVLNPGEHLCHQGEKHEHLYLLRSGILKSYLNKEDGEEFVMHFHFPPELFGWEGIDDEQLSFSTVALDYTNVCEIPLDQLKVLVARYPAIQLQLFKLINQTIRQNNIAMLKLSAEQKVTTFILSLSKHFHSLGYPPYLCQLTMTHQDIANYLRIAPETISRILHNLQDKGLINVQRKKIIINNYDKLQFLSEGHK